jgi:integrase
MNAWLFQDRKQLTKLGKKCPWSVGWYDPEGKRKQKTVGAKSRAEKYARKVEGQLAAGTYENTSRKAWSDFKAEYLERGLPGAAFGTRQAAAFAIAHFERIINPVRVDVITSRTFAEYVAARQIEHVRERAKKRKGRIVSPATINKELRTMRAIVRKAHKWGYLARVPAIDFLKELGRLPTYVSPEHFAKLYKHCDAARWPNDGHYTAAEWWQALLVMAYMTGWRIGSLLALKRQDVDLDAGWALSRAADNKGKRDQKVPLHPLVVEHLKKITSFAPLVFMWEHPRRGLFDQFHAIQEAAGVRLEGGKAWYGFHDLRRAFATMNADKLTPDALQTLMQHKDYQTTQRYINMARQLNPAVQNLFVPELKAATG